MNVYTVYNTRGKAVASVWASDGFEAMKWLSQHRNNVARAFLTR